MRFRRCEVIHTKWTLGLYLLALFQLAGGPLMIGGVLLAGKLWRLGPAAEAGGMTAGAAACNPDEPS